MADDPSFNILKADRDEAFISLLQPYNSVPANAEKVNCFCARTSLSSEQAARDPLADVPEEARTLLWQGFIRALDPALWVWEQTPAGARHALPPRILEHFGERFNDAALPRQPMENMRRLWRIEITLAADLLEAQILDGANDAYAPLLRACCTRIGQLYGEIKRRCGLLFAMLTLRWELRLLRYRGSPVVAPLLFEEVGR